MSYRVLNPFRAFERGYERGAVLTVDADLSCWLPLEAGAAKLRDLIAVGDVEEIGIGQPDSDLPPTLGSV